MKKTIIISVLSLMFLFCGCSSYPELKTEQEAKAFLESNSFHDDGAYIGGKREGASIRSPFLILFENGYAIINSEKLPYTIKSISDGYPHFNGSGFVIDICGSERYAYGGCLKGYLSSGIGNKDDSPSLQLEGQYMSAFFSYIGEGDIVKK